MNLKLMAMRWLRWERRCPIVLSERTPREYPCGRPDVLGITCARFMIEVEIKTCFSDFRQDAKKDSRLFRSTRPEKYPRLFYYLVPVALVDRVRPVLPPWAVELAWPTLGPITRGRPMKSLTEQLASARRELSMRQNSYPKWVASNRMTHDQAAHEIECQQAIVALLERQL